MTSAARLGVLLATLVPVSIVARAQNATDGPQPPPQEVQGLAPSAPAAGSLPVGVDIKTYEIGTPDVIRINVWKAAEFSGDHAVRPDGKITLPLVGDVQAAGLTPERLAAQVTQALGSFMQSPQVTVSVMQVNSKKYTVTGLVLKPGPYPMPTPIRVFEALTLTGGFQQWADKKHITIIHADGPDRPEFNWEAYIKGKNLDQNIYLRNGDTIYVHD